MGSYRVSVGGEHQFLRPIYPWSASEIDDRLFVRVMEKAPAILLLIEVPRADGRHVQVSDIAVA